MIKIKRKYRFYAAHRNEMLNDKCRSLHGHQYNIEVDLKFNEINDGICVTQDGLKCTFDKIDSVISPIIEAFDHALLINKNDPLLRYFEQFEIDHKEEMKMVIFNGVTSVENLSAMLFRKIQNFLPVGAVHVQETNSSVVTFEP